MWVGIPDWDGFERTLRRLVDHLHAEFPNAKPLREAVESVLVASEQAKRGELDAEDVRRRYLRAIR